VIGEELQGLVAAIADQLGGYRYTELRAACVALGVTDHRMLGGLGAFRDSGMIGTPSAEHPRAFVRARVGGPDHERAVQALIEVIEEVRPDVVLTYDADGGYGHPDHIATHEVTLAASAGRVPRVLAAARSRQVAAAALSEMAVPAGYQQATYADLGYLADAAEIGVAVDVRPAANYRRSALAAHATQVQVLPGGFALSNRIAQPSFRTEYFKLLAGSGLPAGATDVFAGLGS
jgi:N-acetyl-1-D-myo-inositol-2-amino-2-deoxy-alpha-D-glucopyranoside deacetylase